MRSSIGYHFRDGLMPSQRATIAFDFSGLDDLNPGNGQYRYCIDLLRALGRAPSALRFVVIGSQPAPAEAIAHLFQDDRWRYLRIPPPEYRGGPYLAHVTTAWRLRRERVDLLHTPHTFLPLASSTPAVVTIHDVMSEIFPEYKERLASRPYRLFKYAVTRRPVHVIAISQTTADDVHRLWQVPTSRISVVYSGFEMASPSTPPGAALAALAGTRFVLSPYNLEPRKNLHALLIAMADVRRGHPDLRLVLYGHAAVTPDRERAFHKDLSELGLTDAVIRTGFISDEELASFYRQSALFVFPSLYEGFGIPVLEAMAAGACVIARNQSAMREILGHTGAQVETEDPSAMAACISSLLDDPVRRAELGRAAQTRAAQFTPDAMARGTLAAYARALARH